jgi:hypothetical protein
MQDEAAFEGDTQAVGQVDAGFGAKSREEGGAGGCIVGELPDKRG